MKKDLFFKKLKILKGQNSTLINDSVIIIDGKIKAFGAEARKYASSKNIKESDPGKKILAPLLVDIHSTLKDPISGFEDNLIHLKFRAKRSGFGVIAIKPDSTDWRDKPEKIPFQQNKNDEVKIYFWGSLTIQNQGLKLSPNEELLKSGAIGLSTNLFDDPSIIFKALSLITKESYPLLITPKINSSNPKAFVNEDINSLQSGLYSINNFSDYLNLKKIFEINHHFPNKKIIIENICDTKTCEELKLNDNSIFGSISWWNLVADTGNLKIDDMGWKVYPPICDEGIRERLIGYIDKNIIQSIAVNSLALNDQETFKPINERNYGISSYELVLPLLWTELISKRNFNISKLWDFLSFKPSEILNLPLESLQEDSNRWLIFDPDYYWYNNQTNLGYESPSNFPKKDDLIKGKVIASGLAL